MSDLAHETLARAARAIRTRTRSPSSFKWVDHFAHLLLEVPFGVPSPMARAVTSDLQILDWLYETLPAAELRRATRSFQEATEPEAARRLLPALHAALDDAATCSLEDAARGILAVTTVCGVEAVAANVSQGHADAWLRLFRGYVDSQNAQQEEVSRLSAVAGLPPDERQRALLSLALPEELLVPPGRTFEDGVAFYLERYAETASLSVAVVGSLPFARGLSRDAWVCVLSALEQPAGLLSLLSRLLRLAPDVPLDPAEPISTGVVGHAAEGQMRIIDVRHADIPRQRVQAQLAEAWSRHLADGERRIERLLEAVAEPSARGALSRLSHAALQVATVAATDAHHHRAFTEGAAPI